MRTAAPATMMRRTTTISASLRLLPRAARCCGSVSVCTDSVIIMCSRGRRLSGGRGRARPLEHQEHATAHHVCAPAFLRLPLDQGVYRGYFPGCSPDPLYLNSTTS